MANPKIGSYLVTTAATAAVAATKTKQNVVVTARTAGSAGNSIAPVFVGTGEAQSLALTDTLNAPSVQLESSQAIKARASIEGVDFMAKVAGAAGNNMYITWGVGETLEYSENGSISITIIDGYTTPANITEIVNIESTLITAEGDSPFPLSQAPETTYFYDGEDGGIISTTAEVATCLNGSTQVTATGGTGATATAEPSFNLAGGANATAVSRHKYQLGKTPVWSRAYFK